MGETTITLLIIAAAVLLLAAAVLISAYFSYKKAFARKDRGEDPYRALDTPKYAPYSAALRKMISDISTEEYESVSLTASDGTHLAGRDYHRQDGAPIHVIFHGYRSTPLRDGAGGGCDSRYMGHNLLLVYQRAHGESGGGAISFGIRERYDVVDWMRYLTERFGENTEIILIGTSMGAATVIMASELGLPKTVRCVIADCPYSSPREVIMRSAAAMGFPPGPVSPFIRLGARLFGGFSIEASSPIEAIKRATLPILLVHGEADSLVPCEMSVRLAEAAKAAGVECSLEIFEGAEHCLPFMADHKRYERIRNEFLTRYIKGMRGGEDAR